MENIELLGKEELLNLRDDINNRIVELETEKFIVVFELEDENSKCRMVLWGESPKESAEKRLTYLINEELNKENRFLSDEDIYQGYFIESTINGRI